MAELKPLADPGPEVADKILSDLEDMRWSPSEVARKARFLRAHIEGLRAEVERLVPRFVQPCFDHEYIDPQCAACGRTEKDR